MKSFFRKIGEAIKAHRALSIVVAIVAILILGVLFLFATKPRGEEPSDLPKPIYESDSQAIKDGKKLSNGQCVGEEKPKITNLPMNEADFSYIIPYGMMIDDHVTPIDHQYFQPTVFRSARDTYPVYAMADAKLVDVGKRENQGGDFEYRLVFSMSCKLFYYYDLVTGLTPEIKNQMANERMKGPITVKAGQQIGWIGGRTLDFAVWDMDVTLHGFIVPEHYLAEPWKIHTADPLLYYTDELKEKALAKYLRTVEPRSGKIDYDIDGKLIGSWFVEGNSGLGKANEPDMDAYKGHISISPDYLDPESYVVSLGDFKGGEAEQFGIRGNAPSPKDIGVESGIIKFELVQKDWVDTSGNMWDRMSFKKGLKAKNQEYVIATALFQLTDKRKLKVEIFPDKKVSEVAGFTSNAKVYER